MAVVRREHIKTSSKSGERGDHDLFGQHLQHLLVTRLDSAAASLVGWQVQTVNGDEACRGGVERADAHVYEGIGGRQPHVLLFPTGTKAVAADELQRIIKRRLGDGGVPVERGVEGS